MADHFDLYNDDYDKFIDHCKKCSGTFAIKVFVDRNIRKYKNENNDIVTSFMERIEANYSEIDYDLEGETPFYTLEILNFNNDYKGVKDPAVRYLYSYLCFLSDNPKEINKIMGVTENDIKVDPNKSFYTNLSKSEIDRLFHFLTQNEFVRKKNQTSFHKIFSNQELTDYKPIQWLAMYRNNVDMIAIFELIKGLCDWEYNTPELEKTFFIKIVQCFERSDNTKLVAKSVERSFYRWINVDHTQKILGSKDRTAKKYLLVEHLQSYSNSNFTP